MATKRAAKKSSRKTKDPLVEFCRTLAGATEDVKWGNDLMFSVGGKMFAGFGLPDNEPMGFKVEPAVFDAMVGKNGVVPQPYAARFHWVSVTDRSRIADSKLKAMLTESHRLVADKLPKKTRAKLGLV
jgi:predicted DNA-binding protein (MmcQ/YjbR family)